MNVVPLFPDRKSAVNLWQETVHWWIDHTVKMRFVEIGNNYWFIISANSKRPQNNKSFYKVLTKSENYQRFKEGHGGEAYLRLGVYTKKYKKDSKHDMVCDCGHIRDDHDDTDEGGCLEESCNCEKFQSFQVNLLKKKKTVIDIKFLNEDDIKDDSLAWNCLYVNRDKEMD